MQYLSVLNRRHIIQLSWYNFSPLLIEIIFMIKIK